MKRFLLIFAAITVVVGCSDFATKETDEDEVSFFSEQLNKEVQGSPLKNYFLSNEIPVKNDYLVEVFQNRLRFDSFLHPAAVAGVHFREIDFDKEFVVMIAGKASNNQVNLSIREGRIEKNNLLLNIRENVSIDTDNFLSTALLAYSFPKEGISKIIVTINGIATEKSVN